MGQPKIKVADLIPGRTFYSQVNPRLYRTVGQVYLEGEQHAVRYTGQDGQAGKCSLERFLDWVNRT